MRASTDTKNLISRYFSFYFLGKFETRVKAISFSFAISLIVMIMAVLTKAVFSVENVIINILFPFTYMGTIGNLLMINKLKDNMANGIKGFEKRMFQSDSSQRTYETAKVNTFLSTLSLFTGVIELVLSTNIINFLIVLVLELITVYTIFYTGSFIEEDKSKKLTLTVILLGVIAIISLLFRLMGLTTLISGNYIIVLTLMFAVVGYMKMNSFISYLFKEKKTNGYIAPIDNYENLKKEDPVENKKVNDRAFTITSTINSMKKAQKETKEFKEFCEKNYKEAHRGMSTAKRSTIYTKDEKEDSVGYTTDMSNEDDVNNRFLARDKR